MKVWIGNYRNPWTTQEAERLWYKWRYDKYDWEVENLDSWDKAVETVLDTWRTLVCVPVNWIKNKIPRIHIVKIDDYDCWSMDSTLAPIILPMLKKLQKNKHGAPYTEDVDVPEHLRSTAAPAKENEWDTDENHFKRWEWILAEMIWAFEQLVDEDNDDQFYSGESDILWQAIDSDGNPVGKPHRLEDRPDDLGENKSHLCYRLVDGPNHTQIWDMEGMKNHHKRIDNGLRLFGTYYRGLWD